MCILIYRKRTSTSRNLLGVISAQLLNTQALRAQQGALVLIVPDHHLAVLYSKTLSFVCSHLNRKTLIRKQKVEFLLTAVGCSTDLQIAIGEQNLGHC